MSKEKQIEEMAVTLCHSRNIVKSILDRKCSNCFREKCDVFEICKDLYNAGYRKQSEVIDEFSDRLKEAPIKLGLPLLGLSTKEEIEEYFDGIMLQVRDAIDKIAKEMKGDEK